MPPSVEAPPDLSGLIELSRVEHLDLKPVILRVQTDLFLRAASRERAQHEIFESLACGLIPTVDEETARIVAAKLAPFPETPPAVLEALAARGGAVREIVLAQAPALAPSLIATLLTGAPELAPRVAARADLPRESVEDLAREDCPEIDRALAGNRGITLRGTALDRLIDRGRERADLARLLLARLDVPPADLAPLYLHADPMRRAAIGRSVEAVAALRPCPPPPRGLGAALAGLSAHRDVPAFIAALADGLGLPRDFLALVDEADTRYDLLALALRAAGLDAEEGAGVLLTLNQGVPRAAERIASLVHLFRAVSRPAARDLIAAFLDKPLAERGPAEGHQPHHGPEARTRHAPERALPRRPAPLPAPIRRGDVV